MVWETMTMTTISGEERNITDVYKLINQRDLECKEEVQQIYSSDWNTEGELIAQITLLSQLEYFKGTMFTITSELDDSCLECEDRYQRAYILLGDVDIVYPRLVYPETMLLKNI